uniref:Tf2-1-like SH3-like domain-containing protein n=2 Tax=Cajanus cajan TaxID=3821 RepID=A0A151QSN0_CAJCA|nr:hypothetical protein KK1_045833 [Cajanus cajan]
MRGCALPLTKLAPPPHLSKFKFYPFPIAAIATHSLTPTRNLKAHLSFSVTVAAQQQQQELETDEEENFEVLTAIKTNYNDILIVDTPKSRMLLLDSSYSVHSILNKEQKWTDSYWDEFASLPAIVPEGPIAILGLGGGTAAHLMLDLWPSLQLDGWEIDQIRNLSIWLIRIEQIARQFQIGDFVYVKLHPYKKVLVAFKKNAKLSPKYFGPYNVIDRVGQVAYKLDIPSTSKVHPVFHVSQLKKHVGEVVSTTALSYQQEDAFAEKEPEYILDKKKYPLFHP